ncbi:MAG: AAA family ATPase [bacterium]
MNIPKEYDASLRKNPRQGLKYLLRLAEIKLDLVWRFEAGEEITSLCVVDYIKSGEKEKQIIVGSKDCCVYSLSIDKELLWKFCAKDEILSLCAFDLDNDGAEEIIVGSKDHTIYILDSKGRPLKDYPCEGPVRTVAIAKDDDQDLIVAGSFNGYIYFIGYNEGIQWSYYCGDRCRVNGLCVAHLGENDRDNVIAVTCCGDVIILDYQRQRLLRRFKKPGSLYAVIAQDIDNDGQNEIIVSSDSCGIYTINSYGREKWRFRTKDSVYSIHCCDIDMDNRFEVIIGTRDDYVYVLDTDGKFKWKYKTDHNVWSIYSTPFSSLRSSNLFAGLSNRMVYYYMLHDWRDYVDEIDKSYTRILEKGGEEWDVLEDLVRDEDEYIRRFAVQKMVTLTNGHPLTQKIVTCLRAMLKDPSPLVRKAVVRGLSTLSDYNPDLFVNILAKETSEQEEAVRYHIVQGLSSMALKMPNKRGDIFNNLQCLNQEWEQIDLKAMINLFDFALNEFITGNLDEALIDFQVLLDRGLDLVSKFKTDGYVCALTYGDIGQAKTSVIALASRNNHLYLFDHHGRLKWDRLTESYAQRIFIEDIDGDGQSEILVCGANGAFQFFSESGEEKGRFLFHDQVNDFYPNKDSQGRVDGLIIGTQEGVVYSIDLLGNKRWHFNARARVLSIFVEDMDHDGHPEIVASTLHGRLFLLDQKGAVRWEKDFQSDIRSINSLRLDTTDILIGTRDGRIYALNNLGNIRWQQSCDQAINNIWISQINDFKRIVVAAQDPSLLILDVKGNKIGTIESFGIVTALLCTDIDHDGRKELVLGMRNDHVYMYKFVDQQEVDAYIRKCKELSETYRKKLFFPRNDILKLISANLENRERKNKVVLVGYQGSGKTNLLWQICSGALGERYLPVYINLHYAKLGGLGEFLWDLAEKITKDLSRKGIYPSCLPKMEFMDNCLEGFKTFFKDLVPHMEGKILLVLLDDFDRLQSQVRSENISQEVFRIFEDMIHTNKCCFVMTVACYNFDLEKKDMNIFLSDAFVKDVNFVDRFAVQQELYRQLGMNLENKEEVVNRILEITGSHAHYLQIAFNIILADLEENKKSRLTGKDWTNLYARIMDAIEEELLNPWESALPLEKVVLSALAGLNPIGAPVSEINRSLGLFAPLIPNSHLSNVLKTLTRKSFLNEIVTDKDIQYTFTISVFRDWIKKKTNPFQVISENARAILQEIPLHLFDRQNRACRQNKQTDLFLQTIGLESKQWNVLATLSQKWSKLIDRKGEINKAALHDFVGYFAELLGFSVKEILEFPRLTCFRFDTPTIRIKKLRGMILAVPINPKPDEVDFQGLIGVIANLDEAPNTFMVLELEESPLFESLASNSKLDLVLLNQENIKSILLEPNHLHTLIDDVVLKYIDIVDLSPYETMGPVDSMFFGRLEEIKTMRQLSHKSFAIIGARQLGKTSLMLNVRNLISHDIKVKTLYLDCSTYCDPLTFFQAIIDGLDLESRVTIKSINEFKRIIRDFCKKEKMRLAFFLDEIDTLLAIDKEQNELIFKTFRSISNENDVSLIVAGYDELYIRTKDIKSPLFNYLEIIKLSSLDKRAAAQLITEPIRELGIRFQDEKAIVEEICQISSCFPNLIQYICKRLIQLIASQKRRIIYPTDLAEVKKDPEFQDYLLSRFFTNLAPLDKAVTLISAGDQEISTSLLYEKLSNHQIYLSIQELSEMLDRLTIASVFSRIKHGVRFTLPFFPFVLSHNMEKELLLKQLIREVTNGKRNSL